MENILKQFVKYVSLNVLGMIGLSCYILADTFFVANGLGKNGLTALNLAIPVYSFINGTGLMIGMGGATRYAFSAKGKRTEKGDRIFTQAALFGLLFAGGFFLLGVFADGALSSLLGAKAEVYGMTRTYLKTLMLFAPAFILNNVCICFVRNDGNPNLSMAAMLTGSFSNIVLDYLFIFPMGMGMFGAAFATGLAPVISLGVLSVHFIGKKNLFFFRRTGLQIKLIKDYCTLGSSSLITELSSGIVIILFNIIILKIEGNTGVAAYGIVANLALVVLAIFTGIAQGMQPLLSKFYGSGKLKEAEKVYRYGVKTALLIAVIVYAGAGIFAQPVVRLFNEERNAVLAAIAEQGIYLYFIGFLFAGFNILTAVYFSSVAQAGKSFVVSVLRGFIIIVPLALVLGFTSGMIGVWLVFPVTELATAAIAFCFKRSGAGDKKEKKKPAFS